MPQFELCFAGAIIQNEDTRAYVTTLWIIYVREVKITNTWGIITNNKDNII